MRRITGVIHLVAIFIASMADQKQSPGLCAARIGIGDSPWRPKSAMRRSACSVFVGMPVEGPPRCTFTMTRGSSVMTARPIISDLSARPGPEVVVQASAPPKAAPIAEPMPAISSSAWYVTTP